MADKKISPKEFFERMKAIRSRPAKPELVEKFNKIVELDEKQERDQQQKMPAKKIARSPETNI